MCMASFEVQCIIEFKSNRPTFNFRGGYMCDRSGCLPATRIQRAVREHPKIMAITALDRAVFGHTAGDISLCFYLAPF